MNKKYERIRMQKERKFTKALQRTMMKALQPVLEDNTMNPDLYDYELVTKQMTDLYYDTSKRFFTDTYKELEVKKNLLDDIASTYAERIENWLLTYGANKVQSVNKTIKQKLSNIINDNFQKGTSFSDMAKEITSQFRTFSRSRALTIARTETTASAGRGAWEGAQVVSGSVLKNWIVNLDGKERQTHRLAGSQYKEGIPLNDPFIIGGDTMMSPGTGNKPEENCNCRCQMGFVRIGD